MVSSTVDGLRIARGAPLPYLSGYDSMGRMRAGLSGAKVRLGWG